MRDADRALRELLECTDMLAAWRMDWGVPYATTRRNWRNAWARARVAVLPRTPLPGGFFGDGAIGVWVGPSWFFPPAWGWVYRFPGWDGSDDARGE
jgi:hypothetical protein